MLSNICRKLSERQFILRRFVSDRNILSIWRNNHEFTYGRSLTIPCQSTKTDKYPNNYLSINTQRFCTNVAVAREEKEKNLEELESLYFDNTELSNEDIEKLLNLDWSKISTEEFIDNFKKLSFYIKQTQEKSNIDFDNLFQGIVELSSKFSIDDLVTIFKYTPVWNDKTKELNDIKKKILNSFDQELINRFSELDRDHLLFFCCAYKRVTLGRKLNFVRKAIFKIERKVKNLSSQEISKFCSVIAYCVNLQLNFYNLEYCIENKWDTLTQREIYNVMNGFLRNEYRIRNQKTRVHIYEIILKNIKEIKSENITAIIKYLTLMYKALDEVDDVIQKILQSLESRLEELEMKSLIAILGLAAEATIDEKTLIDSILERINKEMHTLTITDIERISCSMAVFNYNPNHLFYTNLLREVSRPDRQEEILQHNRAYLRILQTLVYANIYPMDLISNVMDPEFIQKSYKNVFAMKSTNYYFIDQSLNAECPHYTGHVLSERMRAFFSKKHGYFDINEMTGLNKITQEVIKISERLFSIPIYVDKVLPHFFNPDVVFCYDENDNPISPKPFLSPLESIAVKRIPEEAKNYKWIILIITAMNMILKNNGDYSGILNVKCRQLKALGYTPVVLSHNEWYAKKDDEQCEKYQEDYVKRLLNIK